jgi:hypothetical protein
VLPVGLPLLPYVPFTLPTSLRHVRLPFPFDPPSEYGSDAVSSSRFQIHPRERSEGWRATTSPGERTPAPLPTHDSLAHDSLAPLVVVVLVGTS